MPERESFFFLLKYSYILFNTLYALDVYFHRFYTVNVLNYLLFLLRRQGIVQMIPMNKQGNPVIEKGEDKDEESDD